VPDTSAAEARRPDQTHTDPLDTGDGPAQQPAARAATHRSGTDTPAADMTTTQAESTIIVADDRAMLGLLGSRDAVLRKLEEALAADIHVRGNRITLRGSAADIAFAERVVRELLALQEAGSVITPDAVRRTIGILADPQPGGGAPSEVLGLNIISRRGRTIRPKSVNQKRYVDAIDANTVVFGIGPAGTGKTYLAMAKAVQALQAKQVNRIILTRPAVEAGERLGFLPGTLSDKIDPYLRPLYDALHDMLDPESIPRLMAAGTIEVAPLAYMRGRAQPHSAGVLTPDGFRPIGSLCVGDLVIGSDGRPTPVLGVYPQGPREVFRVTTQDGASTLACGEHLWQVRSASDKRRGNHRVLQTSEMVGKLRTGYTHRYELPVMDAARMVEQPVPMDPYALGLLLGGGRVTTSTTPAFATSDPELAVALQRGLNEHDIEVTYKSRDDYVLRHRDGGRGGLRIANPVTEIVRDLGPAHGRSETKFVPSLYLNNSAEVRLALLQGLLDADGGPVTRLGRSCRVQYTTTSPRLREDVIYLVRSLGGVAYTRTRAAAGRHPGRARSRSVGYRRSAHSAHNAHVLDIRLPAGVQPFRLERKKARYDASGGGRPMRFIDSIEPVGVMDTVCIQVAAEDSLYVTDDFLVTHNTLNDAFIILDEAQNTTPEQMKMFLTRLGFGSKIVVTGDVTQVDLPGGQRSGLRIVSEILTDIDDVHFSRLTSADVVRHRLVGDIVDAYERWDAARQDDDEHPAAGGRPGRNGARHGTEHAGGRAPGTFGRRTEHPREQGGRG
jgi:phosphate starvation-inducible PhoH-like protein